jgi:hypothetical protein
LATANYVGKAGHLAAMSELALRGYNVAIPEIDVGDDVFVVNDRSGAMWRIQVKTAQARVQKKSLAFQFRLRENSIQAVQTPDLHFVFVLRTQDRWRFVVLARAVLQNYVTASGLGTLAGTYRQVNFTLAGNLLRGSKVTLSHHLEDWATWPRL